MHMLAAQGCEVSIAGDGLAALEMTRQRAFDLIFMDCQMPQMDGFEAAKALRRREQSSASEHVPIVALTANAVQGDKESCLGSGMDDYVSKPYTEETLAMMLDRWLPDSQQTY